MSENPLKKIRTFIFKLQHPDLDQAAINLIHDQHLRTAFSRFSQRLHEQQTPDEPQSSTILSAVTITPPLEETAYLSSLNLMAQREATGDTQADDPAQLKPLEQTNNEWDSEGNYIPKPADPPDYDPANEGIVRFERNRTIWRSDCSGSWPPHRQSQNATDLTVLCRDLIQQKGNIPHYVYF